jgi:hypothetical protein
MRLSSDNGDYVALQRSDVDAHDVLIVAAVSRSGFSATIDAWISAGAWHSFAQQLSVLEELRQGKASVASLSPGELELTVRSLDRAGHLGAEGLVGIRTFDSEVCLTFSAFAFDPSQLPAFAREARSIAAAIASPGRSRL